MEAHLLVVVRLQPALVQVAQGNPIPVEALVVPELEYIMLGVEAVDAVPAQAGVDMAAMRAKGREAIATYNLYVQDEVAVREQLREALQPLGTAVELLECVRLLPGYAVFKAYLEGRAAAEPVAAAAGAGHGWVLVAGTQYQHAEHGLSELRDMPLMVYWATMTRYFGTVGTAEVLKVKTNTAMVGDESVVVFGTRLTAFWRAVNQAHQLDPTSSPFTEAELLSVFEKGCAGSAVYAGVYNRQKDNLLGAPKAQRTVMVYARKLQAAWEVEQSNLLEAAKLEAQLQQANTLWGASQQQAAPSAQAGGVSRAGIVLEHAGQRHIDEAVASMGVRMQQRLFGSLQRQQQAGQQRPAGGGNVVAVAGGAHGGLQQQQLQQRQQHGPGGHVRPCGCRVRGGHGNQPCFLTNPRLAYTHWVRPPPGSPDFVVYQRHCLLDGVPVAGGGARAQFPAALCVEAATVDQQPQEEGDVVVAAAAGTLPSDEEQQVKAWRANVGGLVYFANVCRERGAVLLTPDGRVYLPTRLLYDAGCEQALIDEPFGLSMGLLPTPVAPRELVTADGGRFQVSHKFVGLRVVLAMGTEHELSVPQDFWAVKGLGKLAQAIFPATLDHTCGSAGVDRVLGLYQYRPQLARGDVRVAAVPVVSHRAAGGLRAAAVGALAQVVQAPKPDPSGEAGSSAGAAPMGRSAAAPSARRLSPVDASLAGARADPQGVDPADELGPVHWGPEPSSSPARASAQVDHGHEHYAALGRSWAQHNHPEASLDPTGRLLWEGRVVLTAEQLQVAVQERGPQAEALFGDPDQPQVGAWADLAPWMRLQCATFAYNAFMIDLGNGWQLAWQEFWEDGALRFQGGHPFGCFTVQPVPEGGETSIEYGSRPDPLALLPAVMDKLTLMDGYSQRAGVWDKGRRAVWAADPRYSTISWGGVVGGPEGLRVEVPPLATEVERALFQWVKRWQQLSEATGAEEVDEQGNLLQPQWDELWQLLYVLWDIFAAPQDTGGTACLGVTEGYGLLQWDFGKTLLDLATLGLQLQHVIVMLQPTADPLWDRSAQVTLQGVGRRVHSAVNQWCREYRVRASRVAGVADMRDTPLAEPPRRYGIAQGYPKRPRVQHPRAGGRHTYGKIRNLLLFLLLALVGLVSGVAGMTPLRQSTSGTFRSHA
jgi:hypothetical protein